jgi:hypothetical protein
MVLAMDLIKGKAKGGVARANALTPEQRKKIAENAAIARWGKKLPTATHMGNFQEEFGINIECYVLDDENKTAVISKRGMGLALGFSEGGNKFIRFISGKAISKYIGSELAEKISNHIVFQGVTSVPNSQPKLERHGYNVSILIDVCQCIVRASDDGNLMPIQENIVKQARLILGASAKEGIKRLVYALAGYNPSAEEVIASFKAYVLEEAKKYEKEFPSELYMQWYRLYEIPVYSKGNPWLFKHLTIRHVYYPLAKSNGKILELITALKAKEGDKQKKLFQFLNEVGARALRMQLGRILEMTESSKSKDEYEGKIIERFGGQTELEIVFT